MACDGIDDRCKSYEQLEGQRRAMKGIPLLARLNGRSFHRFSRDLAPPYDAAMSMCMLETTRHELLFAKGVNWNDYPAFFKRGTYVARRPYLRTLTDEDLERIPAQHRPASSKVERYDVVDLQLPPIRRIINALDVLFSGAEAKT